ncbi:MAG: hypothetical protein ACO1OG_02840 [Devosia sp.]
MHKIFMIIRSWFADFLTTEIPADPLAGMSPQELADLPVHHPRFDGHLSP